MREEDLFRFRTPSLRNVALTGPWGHDGAYAELEDVVRHHLDPLGFLERFEVRRGLLPELGGLLELNASGSRLDVGWLSEARQRGFAKRDDWVQNDQELRSQIAAANELPPKSLTNREVAELMAFLEALTDTTSLERRDLEPRRVPSGLAVQN